MTVVVGIISIWIIVDFPDDATFLEPLEKHVVKLRLKNDGQASYREEKLKWKYITAVFKDWKLYTGIVIATGQVGSVYAFSLFLPSIIHELGYSASQSQLMSVPQYIAACVMVYQKDQLFPFNG